MSECTTGRILNILDVPPDVSISNSLPQDNERDIPKGRPLEQYQIVAPVPVSSGLSRLSSILSNEISDTVEHLNCQVGAVALDCVNIEADSSFFFRWSGITSSHLKSLHDLKCVNITVDGGDDLKRGHC